MLFVQCKTATLTTHYQVHKTLYVQNAYVLV